MFITRSQLTNIIKSILKESNEWSGVESRGTYLDSYSKGASREAFVRSGGLLSRSIFKPATPSSVIEMYYDKFLWPQLKDTIYNVPVVTEKERTQYHAGEIHKKKGDYEDESGAPVAGWSDYVVPHEMAHAIDHQVDLILGLRDDPLDKMYGYGLEPIKQRPRNLDYIDIYRKWTILPPGEWNQRGKTLNSWNEDFMKQAFPELVYGQGRMKAPHGQRDHEVYADIIRIRSSIDSAFKAGERTTNKFTAEDVSNLREYGSILTQEDSKKHSKPAMFRSGDLHDAIKKYSNQALSDEDIAAKLNAISDAGKKDTSVEYA